MTQLPLPQRPARAYVRKNTTISPTSNFQSVPPEQQAMIDSLRKENKDLRALLDETINVVENANLEIVRQEACAHCGPEQPGV